MILCELRNLRKSFPIRGRGFGRSVGRVRAVDDVSFNISAGETLSLVGGSGSGKSTLARMMCGLMAPDDGEILWQGTPLNAFSPQQRAHRVQMIFQDPFASLNPKLSVGFQLAEAIRRSAEAGAWTPGSLLELVGLPGEAMDRYPFQFSGGQRQRIAIARALAVRPTLLIGDEPLSALDLTLQAEMIELFGSLKKSLHLTLLLITHDLTVAAAHSDRMIVLNEGRVVEEGLPATLVRQPRHPYTQRLIEAIPRLKT